MVKEVYGDLLKLAEEGDFDVIVHGCNCQKNMGGGIAYQIAKRYPQVKTLDSSKDYELGDIDSMVCGDFLVVNAYTQFYPGRYSTERQKMRRYKAIEKCMEKVAIEFKDCRIGIPLIGCGISGLEWEKVKEFLDKIFTSVDITVVHYREEK